MKNGNKQVATEHTFLWKLTNPYNTFYDTFDSCVVAAADEESARNISPCINEPKFGKFSKWVNSPKNVIVEKIGVTQKHREGQVIISSFNAG